MKATIEKQLIDACIQPKVWDLGNKVLYDLCSQNFEHDSDEKVLAKVWLIGRSYAVAIERRKNKSDINDNFYTDEVAPAFRDIELDKMLSPLKNKKITDSTALREMLEVHGYLTRLINKLTNLDKRSFSSKYLHFHLPNLFYIFDTRARDALRQFVKNVPSDLRYLSRLQLLDKEYSNFTCKCFVLQQKIYREFNLFLTPRQLDNFLVYVANNRLREKAGLKKLELNTE